MPVNIPSEKVKLILVNKNISDKAKRFFTKNNIQYIETVEIETLNDCTSAHPDMQFLKLDDENILVEKTTYKYYKNLLPNFNIIPIDDIRYPYPFDSALNITIIGDKCFMTEFQSSVLPPYFSFKKIYIKQGYSKCNICILNSEAIITSDKGILLKASQNGLSAYYLPDSEIVLSGYKNGFWGGATGLLDKDKLFFNGDITKLGCYCELQKILDKEKIEPMYLSGETLEDTGSIIPIL